MRIRFRTLERRLNIDIDLAEEVRCGFSKRGDFLHLHKAGASSSVCGRQVVNSMLDSYLTYADTRVRLCPYCFAWAQRGDKREHEL
jgi:hypothetical protein